MVGVGLSTKDDNLRNDRWQIIIRKDVKVRLFITALLDGGISITKDDNNYYTEDDYYCYFLSNVITSFLFQLLFAVWLLLFWDNHTYWHINIKSAIKLIQNKTKKGSRYYFLI